MKIVYSRHYDISFFGMERVHPFDSKKYGRAWRLLQTEFGASLAKHHVPVDRPVSDEELAAVHSHDYLQSLRSAAVLAAALEIPFLRLLPGWLIAWRILRPMKWAVRGSVLAAQQALEHGAAANLSGGYHHAKRAHGEGFCVFSDIALIVEQLRQEKRLQPSDVVLYVSTDAHQGNGVCHQFRDDLRVAIYDAYNQEIYPRNDLAARRRINTAVPLSSNCDGRQYLAAVRRTLPAFLDSWRSPKPRLTIYNAGTDVFARDKLGGFLLSAEDVLARDLFVTGQLRERGIPFVMLLSGGYSWESHRLVATTLGKLLQGRGAP